MLNKYEELHDQFMELLGKYHNQHMTFMARPNPWNIYPLIKTVMEISRHIKDIKEENRELKKILRTQTKIRKQLVAERKAKKLERKINGLNDRTTKTNG